MSSVVLRQASKSKKNKFAIIQVHLTGECAEQTHGRAPKECHEQNGHVRNIKNNKPACKKLVKNAQRTIIPQGTGNGERTIIYERRSRFNQYLIFFI